MAETEGRWQVYLDGEVDKTFARRREAREYARWLRRHPAVGDRRQYAGIGGVQVCGRVEIRDATAPVEWEEGIWDR